MIVLMRAGKRGEQKNVLGKCSGMSCLFEFKEAAKIWETINALLGIIMNDFPRNIDLVK